MDNYLTLCMNIPLFINFISRNILLS